MSYLPRGAIQDYLPARRRYREDLEEEKEDPRRQREGRDRKKRDRKDAHKHARREDRSVTGSGTGSISERVGLRASAGT